MRVPSILPPLSPLGLLLCIALPSCCGGPRPLTRGHVQAIERLEGQDLLGALEAVLDLERAAVPEATLSLYLIQRDASASHELRSAAAAALCRQGFMEAARFCLAVLTANLADFAKRAERFALPMTERWAFARELAYEGLRTALEQRGKRATAFDVNYGAPDLAGAARRLRLEIESCSSFRPYCSKSVFAKRTEEEVQGLSQRHHASWKKARQELLHASWN